MKKKLNRALSMVLACAMIALCLPQTDTYASNDTANIVDTARIARRFNLNDG